MTSILIERGTPTLEVPDGDGEIWSYRFAVVRPAPGGARWAVRLVRIEPDPKSNAPGDYLVCLFGVARFECDCPDAKYRGYRKRGLKECKHCTAARDFAALLAEVQSPLAPPPLRPHPSLEKDHEFSNRGTARAI